MQYMLHKCRHKSYLSICYRVYVLAAQKRSLTKPCCISAPASHERKEGFTIKKKSAPLRERKDLQLRRSLRHWEKSAPLGI